MDNNNNNYNNNTALHAVLHGRFTYCADKMQAISHGHDWHSWMFLGPGSYASAGVGEHVHMLCLAQLQ